MNKEDYARKLKQEIVNLRQLQKVLRKKNPPHHFLEPLIGNAIGNMVDLLCFLEGKNPYYPVFNEPYFNNRQAAMHRTFFSDFHVVAEDGLRQIIKENGFKVVVSRREKALSMIEEIKKKITDYGKINKELNQILKLAGNHASFNDYLNTVLNNIKSLDNKYRKEARIYFDAINIIRNKVSHSDMSLSDQEKDQLVKAKFKSAISPEGSIQMTFEGYKNLITDIIQFLDKLYANL